MKKFYLPLSVALVACPFTVGAETILYVSPTGGSLNSGTSQADALNSIQNAVNKADGPTVIYLEKDATFDVYGPESIVIGKDQDITIIGDNTTIKSGDKQYLGDRPITVGTGSNFKLSGVTVINGCTRDGIPGGAIFFEGNEMNIDHCTFQYNEANNAGGAIASCGRNVTIDNCVFDSNRVFGGYATGGVIYHCGTPDGQAGCSLKIHNTSFTNNVSKQSTRGDIISFHYAYRNGPHPFLYSNVTYFELVNSLFKDNEGGIMPSDVSPRPCDIYTNGVRDDFEMNLVNNTFYKTKALAFTNFWDSPRRLINNVFYNKGENGFTLISSYESADGERDPLIAYNNAFVCDWAENKNIDEPALNEDAAEYGNIRLGANEISALGISARTTTDDPDSYAYFIAITDPDSPLIDAGLASSLTIPGCTAELVPGADIRGVKASGTRDIGCFEYASAASIESAVAGNSGLIAIERGADAAMFTSVSGEPVEVAVYLIDGRKIFSGTCAPTLTVRRDQLSVPNGILIIKATDGTATQSAKTLLF